MSAWSSGWVALRGAETGSDTPRAVSWWTSPDGFEWTNAPFPVPVEPEDAHLAWTGDAWWLWTWAPTTIWRSTDGTTWAPIDLGGLAPAEAPGLDWELSRIGAPSSVGGTALFPVTYAGRLDRLLGLGDLPQGTGISERSDDSWAVVNDSGPILIFRAEETGGGLRLVNADGSVVAEIAGASIDHLRGWARDWAQDGVVPSLSQLLAVDSSSTRAIALPGWPDQTAGARPALLDTPGSIAAFAVGPGATLLGWTSPDGRTWSGPEPAEIDGAPDMVRQEHGGVTAIADGQGVSRAWWTADGDTWLRSPGSTDAGAQRIRGG